MWNIAICPTVVETIVSNLVMAGETQTFKIALALVVLPHELVTIHRNCAPLSGETPRVSGIVVGNE